MVDSSAAAGQRGDGRFSFRSDRLALDFAATRMFRSRGDGALELLDAPSALGAWLVASGLVGAAPPCSAPDLERAIALREAVYRLCAARTAHEPFAPADAAIVNRSAAGAPLSVALGDGGALVRSGTAARALSTLARDAIELLGGPEAARLRRCARAGCTRLFVDRSRAGSRAWCGMAACGNRVKAAAYRRRRRAAGR